MTQSDEDRRFTTTPAQAESAVEGEETPRFEDAYHAEGESWTSPETSESSAEGKNLATDSAPAGSQSSEDENGCSQEGDQLAEGKKSASPSSKNPASSDSPSEQLPLKAPEAQAADKKTDQEAAPEESGPEDSDALDLEAQLLIVQAQLDQAKADLARSRAETYNLQQEYRAYVRRSKGELDSFKQAGRRDVLNLLISVLDDIYAARQAEELTGPFASIATKLENSLETNFKLVRYGQVGDKFDPQLHEALFARESTEVQEPQISQVIQPGYKLAEEVLRATQVMVLNPA